MYIPIWSHDLNPAVDRRSARRSLHYCTTEVSEDRARWVDEDDHAQGIWLYPPEEVIGKQYEHRGSPESRGLLTAHESNLNAEYRKRELPTHPYAAVHILSAEYESRLDEHISQGRKGTPRVCAVIAAKVKTILSNPELVRV